MSIPVVPINASQQSRVMRQRQGFTLIELLVALALVIFMMVILSEAFSVGLESFRRLKAIGDMNARLRTAMIVIQSDLQADHFEGRKRLSDPDFWREGPPQQGFFRIYHGSPLVVEVDDSNGDGINATRTANHILHFTVKRRGNDRKDFFTARVPAGSPLLALGIPDARFQEPNSDIYTSQWAEIAYFLRPNGETAGSTTLYALYRRQRLAVPDSSALGNGTGTIAGQANQYLEVSYVPTANGLLINDPIDLTVPQRRFGMDPNQDGGVIANNGQYLRLQDEQAAGANPDLTSADLLLPDVISFEVTVLLSSGSEFVDLFHETVQVFSNSNPLFSAPNGPRMFDTWTSVQNGTYDYSTWEQSGTAKSIPLYRAGPNGPQIRIVALKITLRVWDAKTQQARQVSLIQDM
ncbi:MAG TPA: prepilin-type N-terminal cleavage/methylation domain-containing protein [Gemmataceae bacterium]|nr:prepilin-type N-terminal cleavage/methylation domain-containing protein [Gemmataceae bacterium]